MCRVHKCIIVVHLLLALGLELDDPLPASKKKSVSQTSDKIASKLPR